MSNSPAVVCEDHGAGSSGDGFSSDEVLFREKRGISKDSAVESSDKETDQNEPPSSGERGKRDVKQSLVVMPDRKSYYITEPDTSNWINGTTPAERITLSPTGMLKTEYDLVLKQFTEVVESPMTCQVKKIEKIVNGWTWRKYKHMCRWILTESGDDGKVNERMLFHGTKAAVQEIVDKGFDERYARGGLYGYGVYFSPFSSKCDQYTSFPGEMHMFLCRVALGKVHRSLIKDYSHAPPGYHSVEGDFKSALNDCVEMIVYNGEQVYPEYLITYVYK